MIQDAKQGYWLMLNSLCGKRWTPVEFRETEVEIKKVRDDWIQKGTPARKLKVVPGIHV